MPRHGVVVASGIISLTKSGKMKQMKWMDEIRFIPRRDLKRGEFMVRMRPCDNDLTPVPWPMAEIGLTEQSGR